jgi:hypothetical protein
MRFIIRGKLPLSLSDVVMQVLLKPLGNTSVRSLPAIVIVAGTTD